VLDPFAPEPLSAADRRAAERGGIVAVDCSWNRISRWGELPAMGSRGRPPGINRRLPMLVATNPQHYGRTGELNTAEALAASLCVLGRPGEAAELLEGFAGGAAFFEVNRERLGRYARARSAEAVRDSERALYGRL
jgi:pre-rRNA-processing protein TSR3